MKKIGVQKLRINKLAINRKINPGGPVSGCENYCSGDDTCPAVCNGDTGCPSVCWNDGGCGGFCTLLGSAKNKGGLVSNPARRMNIVKVRKVR